MDKNSVVIAALAITAVVVLAAAYCIGNDRDDGDIADQYWYQVGYYGYGLDDGEVEYHSSDEYDHYGAVYDLTVFSVSDGMFCGEYYGCNITGTYADDQIRFMGYYDGATIYFCGTVQNGMLNAIAMSSYDSGLLSVYYTVYSTDLDDVGRNISVTDISGSWELSDAIAVTEDGTLTPLGTGLEITEQNGAAFTGVMEQQIDGETVETNVMGTFTGTSSDGYQTAYAIDSNSERWDLLISEDRVHLMTAEFDDGAGLVAVERTYTRDGSPVDTPVYNELEGTQWTEVSGQNAVFWNTYTETFNDYVLTFEERTGNVYSGTIRLNGTESFMTAYSLGSTELRVYSEYKDEPLLVFCDLVGDELTMTEYFTSVTLGGQTAQVATMVQDVRIPETLAGTWSSMYSWVIYDDGTSFFGKINDPEPNVLLGDIAVSEYSDGLFRMYFDGYEFVGTFADGEMHVTGDIDYGEKYGGYTMSFYMTGVLVNDHIMEVNILTEDSEGSYSIWGGIYTTRMLVAYPNLVGDISGEWSAAGGDAYYLTPDSAGPLAGDTMTVEQIKNLISGTFERDVDGTATEVTFIGVLSDYGESYLIDSTGAYYEITLCDGYFCLDISQLTASGFRLYSDGSGQDIDFPSVSGTWELADCHFLVTDSGSYEAPETFTIRFDLQYGGLVTCTIILSEGESSVAGYISPGDTDRVRFAFEDMGTSYTLFFEGDVMRILGNTWGCAFDMTFDPVED